MTRLMKPNGAVVLILKELQKLEIENILLRHETPSRFGVCSVFDILLLKPVDVNSSW